MKNPFSKIFRNQPKSVPERIKLNLISQFPDAINIDWDLRSNIYEAIFYLNEVEHIAILSDKGELMEYKKNLWPSELPEKIIKESKNLGEIMNSIAIYKGEKILYEIIIRKQNMDRKLLIFNHTAELLESKEI